MKKYVFISPSTPSKHGKGYQKILHERLMLLRNGSCVSLVVCCALFGSRPSVEHLKAQYDHLQLDVIVPGLDLRDFFMLPIRVLLGFPLQVLLHQRIGVDRVLKTIFSKHPDARVYCLMSRSFHKNVSLFRFSLIDFVDSMQLNFERRSTGERKKIKSKLFSIEADRMRRWDASCLSLVREAVVVSKLDAEYLSSDKVTVVPIGVDKYEGDCKPLGNRNGNIVFSGNMNYWPNIEAVDFFLEKCWPEIRSTDNSIEFHILGRGMSRAFRDRCAQVEGVQCIGEVDDMQAALSNYPLSIAPMQSGSGMQFKIIEAFSVGCVVISSGIAAANFKNDKNHALRIAEKPQKYVEIILKVMQDLAAWDHMSLESINYASAQYGWEAADEIMCKLEWNKNDNLGRTHG